MNSPLSVPKSLIIEIQKNLINSKQDSNPLVCLGSDSSLDSFELRKYNDILYLLPRFASNALLENNSWKWDVNTQINIPTGSLSSKSSRGKGIAINFITDLLEIKGRSGKERCQPFGRNRSQSIKKLLQEYSVPPWIRDRLPIIYIGNEIAAVADLWVCKDFQAKAGNHGLVINWSDNVYSNLHTRR